MNFGEAVNKVEAYLAEEERKINTFGSALPGYVDPNIKLKILSDSTEEYDFGWVFYYNSARFIETGDFREALAGNAPLIVNRENGEIVVTGTARETSYYIENYIKTGDPQRES